MSIEKFNIEKDELERLMVSYNFFKQNQEAVYTVWNDYDEDDTNEKSISKVIQRDQAYIFAKEIRLDLFKLGVYIFTRLFNDFSYKMSSIGIEKDTDNLDLKIFFNDDTVCVGLDLDDFCLWGQSEVEKNKKNKRTNKIEKITEWHHIEFDNQSENLELGGGNYDDGDDLTISIYDYDETGEFNLKKLEDVVENLQPAANELIKIIEEME